MSGKQDKVNNGYIHPMVCGSCLKLWVDNEKFRPKEETIGMFGQPVPLRDCPKCIHDSGRDWPGTSRV